MSAPRQLRVEHLGDAALGIGDRAPRLSWQLPDGTALQEAYCLRVNGGEFDRVESSECVLVPWPGGTLGSRARIEWRVKVWTDARESEWSKPAWFETTLLDAADWRARWIEPEEPERGESDERPAYVLQRAFTLDSIAPGARLYATAHGCYETFLNGHRVGDMELTPGFTSYWANVHVQSYDVGNLVVVGENVWEVVLSDGWYRGRTGFRQERNCYGDTVAFLGQLHVGDAVIGTDGEWRSATGPIRAADLMRGQVEDHRVPLSDWRTVLVADHDFTRLAASPSPPVRRVQELRPASVARLDAGRQIVDLGQTSTAGRDSRISDPRART